MRLQTLALLLILRASPALAQGAPVPGSPLPSKDQPPISQLSRSSRLPLPKDQVTVNDEGHVEINGKTFTELHPVIDKRVIEPTKKILKPVTFADAKLGFKKARSIISHTIIITGKKWEPYQPAAGLAITGNQVLQMVTANRR